MADPFTGEIRPFGFNFAPINWAFCNGQQVQISQNTALFSLFGTTYGGNGTTNFNLPNLQGRTPMDFGNGVGLSQRDLGDVVGAPFVSLDSTTMPAHNHFVTAQLATSTTQLQVQPSSNSYMASSTEQIYRDSLGTPTSMDIRTVGQVGGSQPHENRQPFLALNLCICLYGEFPPHP